MNGAVLDLREQARAHALQLPDASAFARSAERTWALRMVNEYASSFVFAALGAQIESAGFSAADVDRCRAFSAEERRHGVLCGAVVEALGGRARERLPAQGTYPLHADVAPVEGAVRNLLSICCLSETVAVALIGAERLQMPPGDLRDLLTTIYADEVGHARFGWEQVTRIVPELDAAARVRLGRYLVVAFGHLERHELGHLPVDAAFPDSAAALGLCNGADARVLFYEAIDEIIVPRLEGLGLPAREAWLGRRNALG